MTRCSRSRISMAFMSSSDLQQLCFYFCIDWQTAQWLACTIGHHLHTSDLAVNPLARGCYRLALREDDCSNRQHTSFLYRKYLEGVLWKQVFDVLGGNYPTAVLQSLPVARGA